MILENKPGATLISEGMIMQKMIASTWKDAWNRHVTSLYKFSQRAGDKSVEHILNVCAGNTKTIVQNSFTHVFQRWLEDCEPTEEDTKVQSTSRHVDSSCTPVKKRHLRRNKPQRKIRS